MALAAPPVSPAAGARLRARLTGGVENLAAIAQFSEPFGLRGLERGAGGQDAPEALSNARRIVGELLEQSHLRVGGGTATRLSNRPVIGT